MPDKAERPTDPLRMGLKSDAADIRSEMVGDVAVFVIGNENLYPKQAAEVTAVVQAYISPVEHPNVLIDLSAVEFLCSAFIGQLVDLHKQATEQSGSLKVCVTGGHAAYTMKLVKLNKLLDMGGDREKLIASF